MDQESYIKFYNHEYRKLYVGKETATLNFFEDQKRKGKKIYNYLNDNGLLQKDSLFVLEVGCGAGGILEYFKEKGHRVKGIDLGEEYVNFGKSQGLDLEVSLLSDLKLDSKPDIIIYSHVMEHILDLDAELDAIKNHLSDESIAYIEVPGLKEIHRNYKSNTLTFLQNAHTFNFTKETLISLFLQILGKKMPCVYRWFRSCHI